MYTLTSSSFVCPMLWGGLYIDPVGEVRPCCVGPVAGNLHSASLQKIWNSDTMQSCRERMLQGERIPECSVCYDQEDRGVGSVRLNYIKEFESRELPLTGSIKSSFKPRIIDLRFSNLCNLKCRSCWPGNCSRWQVELGLPKGMKIVDDSQRDELKYMVQSNLNDLIEIYFAGGEPTLIEEDWEILKTCVLLQKTNIHLRYSTNLMNLTFKGQSILDWWERWLKRGGKLDIHISVDGVGKVVEYVRTGVKWKILDSNIRKVVSRLGKYPNCLITFSPVVSTLNVLHIPDLLDYAKELGLQDWQVSLNNILIQPRCLNIRNFTDKAKETVRKELEATCIEGYKQTYKDLVFARLNEFHEYWDDLFHEECAFSYGEDFNKLNPPLANWWLDSKLT